jgi:hypothetical protein
MVLSLKCAGKASKLESQNIYITIFRQNFFYSGTPVFDLMVLNYLDKAHTHG